MTRTLPSTARLIDVMEGKNLVIQGPPGTGKSQTITNVVANVLGNGGTVLFLAEKLARLEVVKRRMDKAKLGEFCLELHSDRAASRRVIESLKARHAIGYGSRGQPKSGVGPAWREARREIADYLAALHRPLDGGTTTFAAMWKSLRARSHEQLQLSRFADLQLPDELLARCSGRRRVCTPICRSIVECCSNMCSVSACWCLPLGRTIEFGETVGAGSSGPIAGRA